MAFCWKFCGNIKVISVCLLLFFFIRIEADENDCIVHKSKKGETRISNAYAEGEYYCIWSTISNAYSKVDCSIDIPSESDRKCTGGTISVQMDGKNDELYCGKGILNFEAIDATIKFYLPSNSKGNFICTEKFDENNCKCGWKKLTRIVGGEETEINEFPMMCGLIDISKSEDIYCGCTIISHYYVLTAAHCLHNISDIAKLAIVVGEHDVTTGEDTKATKVLHVSKYIKHPHYNNGMENDIALCKTKDRIPYSLEVGPICLPFQNTYDLNDGAFVIALGWGLLEFAGRKSDTLQKAVLNVISLEKCKKDYPTATDKNMCTYTPKKDTCQMDSGGPLLVQNSNTHNLILEGITSQGIACASDKPAINTRVRAFIKWIEDNTPDVQYCKKE